MTEKIEHFYQVLYQELLSKLGVSEYKGVDVVPMAVQFYLNTFINSKTFLHRIEKVATHEEMLLLKERYFEGFFKPQQSRFRLAAIDISRYLYHKLFYKSQQSNADYFIFITNKKFFSFIKPVKEALERKGKKVDFLLWDKNDSDSTITDKMHLPKTDFPDVKAKSYTQYHNFTTLIDRASGFLPLLKNKKLILIEGDLESQHTLGLLARKNQFETCCLQWGFFGKTATKSGWRDMPYDKFLVWGEFFADNFKAYNKTLAIVSTGHPTLKEQETSEKGKVILFAVQKQFGEHITTQDVLDFIHFAVKTASQMPDYTIIVRSHPDFEIPEKVKLDYKAIENIVWHNYKNFSLNQSFDGAKYCVSISSTVSLESTAYGCYPVYLRINDLPLQIHELLHNSAYRHVFGFDNFVEGIQHLETQNLKNYLADFKTRLYKNTGTAAINAIVSELI